MQGLVNYRLRHREIDRTDAVARGGVDKVNIGVVQYAFGRSNAAGRVAELQKRLETIHSLLVGLQFGLDEASKLYASWAAFFASRAAIAVSCLSTRPTTSWIFAMAAQLDVAAVCWLDILRFERVLGRLGVGEGREEIISSGIQGEVRCLSTSCTYMKKIRRL